MLKDRSTLVKTLSENTEWDMVIVGGGITGVGVLREAVRRGYKALLIEQKDFSWGTSSRSSKMVHGGLRYLALGDLKLTRHSLTERERLIREAPGLVERMGYYFMLQRGRFPGRFAMGMALTLYDWIAALKNKAYRHRYLSAKAVKDYFSGINTQDLKGASFYSDAVTDDSRLVLRVLHEAVNAGGTALNYVKACSLENDNQVLHVEDCETNTQYALKAKVVVNATGTWAGSWHNQLSPSQRIRPLRGSHVVLPKEKLPLEDAVSLYHPWDKRPVFLFPWDGTTVIGTTDLDHKTDLNTEASITQDEFDYLLAIAQHQFPNVEISSSDVISTFAGVRPVIASDNAKDPGKERRDHALWQHGRLITVSGGKLTTFRLIALDVIQAATHWLPKAQPFADDRVFKPLSSEQQSLSITDTPWATRLLGRHGQYAKTLLQQAPNEAEKLSNTQYCLAECRWALQHEAVVHLDDLLLRRTRLGLLLKNGAEELFDKLKPLCCDLLGWSDDQWQQETARYQKIIQAHYALPTS